MSDTKTFTIAETYKLPSGGLIYEKPVAENITLKSMTARHEMQRLNATNMPLKTLADIIEDCMIDKPATHVYDLAVGDYEFLLHKLRIVTYGSGYKVNLICPYCEESIEAIAQLDDLEVKPFNREEFETLRTITLPSCGKTVTLKVQTPRMLDNLETKTKELKKKAPDAKIHFETFAQLLLAIDTVDDQKLNSVELEFFINDLSARDLNKLMNTIDKLNNYIGLNNRFIIPCPSCGEPVSTFFRFGPEFFRPTTD